MHSPFGELFREQQDGLRAYICFCTALKSGRFPSESDHPSAHRQPRLCRASEFKFLITNLAQVFTQLNEESIARTLKAARQYHGIKGRPSMSCKNNTTVQATERKWYLFFSFVNSAGFHCACYIDFRNSAKCPSEKPGSSNHKRWAKPGHPFKGAICFLLSLTNQEDRGLSVRRASREARRLLCF